MIKPIYPCQSCGKKTKTANSIPHVRMGSVALQKIVCDDCFIKAKKHMAKFWKETGNKNDPYCCSQCSGDLDEHGKAHAQKENEDGTLSHSLICGACFDNFMDHCNGKCGCECCDMKKAQGE